MILKDTIIFDGAFGTYIAQRNLSLDFPEMANITSPDVVLDIHKEYTASGADAIKTNTFAANSGLISDVSVFNDIIRKGFDLASLAVADSAVKVFADIGPVAGENASYEYRRIADIFIGCGAKNFLFETLNEIKNLQSAIAYIKNTVPGSLVIASFAVGQDGYTKSGEYYETLLDEAAFFGTDYVGLNCICGPSHMLDLIRKLPTNRYNLSAMPNSGYPTTVNGRTVYNDNPGYYSEKLFEIYSHGVNVIGGCCGTTPEHIRKFREKKENFEKQSPKIIPKAATNPRGRAAAKESFNKTGAAIAVEINAPADLDMSYTLKAAKKAKEHGADFVTVPDSPLGKTRANSLIISSIIKRTTGIETIPHICCRDKNQIAIKGDLIAANIEGICNVLAVTGDPVAEINRSDAKHVFGFNSTRLIGFIKNLNDTVFSSRPFTICAALNTSSENFDAELQRARDKLAAGADCFLTQPIFSKKNTKNLLTAKETLNCKILAGIIPIAGYKNALFLNNEVPGIEIPDEIIERLKDKDVLEAREISVDYAIGIIEKIKTFCDGYYIMTPLKRIDFSVELIKYIRGNGI